MNLVVLSGAGLSAESGIKTFRDSGGLWESHSVADVATPKGWKRDRNLVNRFYNQRRNELNGVEPNAAHYAIARLERKWTSGGFLHVTQNIDDLSEKAGAKIVCHIHGELLSGRCSQTSCEEKIRLEVGEDITSNTRCTRCGSQIRPDVVWFGEMPYHLAMIEDILDRTDILIVVGTSGQVMPASLFATAVRQANPNAQIIEVNPHPTGDRAFNRVIEGLASVTMPDLVEELLTAQEA